MVIPTFHRLIPLMALLPWAIARGDAPPNAPDFAWQRTETSLALENHGKTVWRLIHDPTLPKTCFHPLASIDGEVLTGFQPPDHPWHRGLWWSWKFINGVNYWEENRNTGASDGLTRLVRAKVEPADDFSARATLVIHYHPPQQEPLLIETRRLAISPPDADGTYTIDWQSEFTAGEAPVKLDRTLPQHLGGAAHGGYAGLSLRMAKGLDGFAFRTRDGETTAAQSHGKPASWVGLAGPRAGIAILDHPTNPRHQPPWYLHSSPQMLFHSPSPLFDEPLELAPGASITFTFRVIVHSQPLAPAAIDARWQSFSQPQPNPQP